MKKLFFPAFTIAAVLVAGSCSTKFNTAAPYKNITVVNAYLDMADTAHYVRIQKAFLDQNKSALTMAQTPDSSYYANINVKIKRIPIADTNSVADTIHLNRVDLNLEGYPKATGVFFQAPNYAYKFTNALDAKYLYRIVITNLNTGQVDSATAPIIDDNPHHLNPNNGLPYFFSTVFTDTGKIDFSMTGAAENYQFRGTYFALDNFSFEGINTPAVISQAIMRFNWQDSDFTTHTKTPHSYDFSLGFATTVTSSGNGQIYFTVPNQSIFNALSSGMGTAPANVVRLIDTFDIFVYLGTQDFVTYQANSLTQGVGLTGTEIEPIFTNIKGGDALGLFTSRALRTGKMRITNPTLQALIDSPIMQHTKITGLAY